VITLKKLTPAVLLTLSLLGLSPTESFASANADKHKARADKHNEGPQKRNRRSSNQSLKRSELKEAEARLAEMGYGTGPVDGVIDGITRNALIAFQKWEGRKVTSQLSREDFDAIMSASAPTARDSAYSHVEVDLDRQVLLFTDSDGVVQRVLPVSTGSDKRYNEKGIKDLAYTPRGRFRIYAKLLGWRRSQLGLLYYPNYFSGGLAIHGNPSVPRTPESHGCVRIPMAAAAEMSKLLPVGTIVLIYDQRSFVSAKEWAEADKQKTVVSKSVSQ
jgi:lipoprotein-anchoring transpeptidase ErfK/SrfK